MKLADLAANVVQSPETPPVLARLSDSRRR
jgi:hypothetical protein